MNKTVSFKIDEINKNSLINTYKDFEISVNNEYVSHAYKINDITITLYTSNSVVFAGIDADELAKQYGYKELDWLVKEDHCGSDEVGTGDSFGPIVVAASFVKSTDYEELNKLGIKDSKKLTDKFILKVTPKLIKKYPHVIIVLNNEEYNASYSKEMNMNKIKALMHNAALYNLSKKVKTNKFVIDQFCSEDNYYSYIDKEDNKLTNITFFTKGESLSPAVALSSMIARFTFLTKMKELEKEVKMKLPLGSGKEASDLINKIKKENPSLLNKIAKLNFKNIK